MGNNKKSFSPNNPHRKSADQSNVEHYKNIKKKIFEKTKIDCSNLYKRSNGNYTRRLYLIKNACFLLKKNPESWYRVSIVDGANFSKKFLTLILEKAVDPIPFVPLAWCNLGKTKVFFVEDYVLAKKLNDSSGKIEIRDRFKLYFRVRSGLPDVIINSRLEEKIELAIKERYISSGKALDLSKFHSSPHLMKHFCGLLQPNIFSTVIRIVTKTFPELEALKLDDNKLTSLDQLGKYKEDLPNLKILHLKNNNIKSIHSLRSLKKWPIVQLVLDENPLFKDAEYKTKVRDLFPKLLKLDEIDLEECKRSSTLETSNDVKIENIGREFLQQYFLIYDSNSREQLQAAYRNDAEFAIKSYLNEGEGVIKIQGDQAITSFLTRMPTTKHDVNGFNVSLTGCETSMEFTIFGRFMEFYAGMEVQPIRNFWRKFVVVPHGSGYCISTEEFQITNPTQEENQAVAGVTVDENVKQQTIRIISEQTGMNFEFSRMCLENAGWEINQAFELFTNVNKAGAIPKEAFIR